jgi:hypothetical protein
LSGGFLISTKPVKELDIKAEINQIRCGFVGGLPVLIVVDMNGFVSVFFLPEFEISMNVVIEFPRIVISFVF